MSSTESRTPSGMQRDLRIWWWTIAVVGFSACVGLLAVPATARIRPLILGCLAAFIIIGVYQRRKTRWPETPHRVKQWRSRRCKLIANLHCWPSKNC